MNCQKFENVVSELARSQIIEAEVREVALAHTAECVRCKQRLQHEELLTRGLRALSMEVQSAQAPGDIELRLREAFRARPSFPPAAVAHSGRRYWLVAAAAILLIVCSVLAIRWRVAPVTGRQEVANSSRTSEAQQAVSPVSPSTPEKEKVVDKKLAVNHTPKPKPRYRPRPREANVGNSEVAVNKEVTTEFMPLGYLNPASLQDGGQIVRIELPRSKLASFGLPVNMERYNEKVKADVLLGVDGLAHAIRFVQ